MNLQDSTNFSAHIVGQEVGKLFADKSVSWPPKCTVPNQQVLFSIKVRPSFAFMTGHMLKLQVKTADLNIFLKVN